jgi:hypothetical protein
MQTREQSCGTTRDMQRQRVYNAEREAFLWLGVLDFERFSDLVEYIRKVASSKRVMRAYPSLRNCGAWTIIERGHGHGACATENELTFRPGSWYKALALHEFAHLLHRREKLSRQHPDRYLKGYVQGHGWRWCQIYMQLVRWFLGSDTERALKTAFKLHRVRWRTPRRISPEQRLVLANRLRRMRGDPCQPEVRHAA